MHGARRIDSNRIIGRGKAAIFLAVLLCGCASHPVPPPSGHLDPAGLQPAASIPAPVTRTPVLPPPKPTPAAETYSVAVTAAPVQELLFALARDARLNVDIHPGIEGTVTLNAIDQTLPQILNRIARQVDLRFEMEGATLAVQPDTAFLRSYRVDYLNMARDATANVSIATQIAGGGGGLNGGNGSSGATYPAGSNSNSTTSVTNQANNRFWPTLVQNVRDILRETDKVLPEGNSETTTEQVLSQNATGTPTPAASASRPHRTHEPAATPVPASLQSSGTLTTRRSTFREAASVIANPETGVLVVRATGRQHERIQEFLDQVMASARRQVLIEATVVEVQLSDRYQQGIDWQRLSLSGHGFTIRQGPAGPNPFATGAVPGGTNPAMLVLSYSHPGTHANFTATVSLLESFGKVKVLSSPKVSVMNNQTAMLKVVDNRVYFTIDVQVTPATQTSPAITTYATTVHTVPEGFVMSVTPQIDEHGTITLNVRPTISRIINYVNDPSPALAAAGVVSPVPEIQTREMESLLRVDSGQIAVMGGLMQDALDHRRDGVPGLSRIPLLGNLFAYRNDANVKTELVIFLRPVVIQPGLAGDADSITGALGLLDRRTGGKP